MFDRETFLTEELLSVASDHELDRFLGDFLNKVGRDSGRSLGAARGRALGGILKAVAKQELPGLTEDLEDEEGIEEVEDFLRFAFRAARKAGRIRPAVRPRAAARLAVTRAARRRRPLRRRRPRPRPRSRARSHPRSDPRPRPSPRPRPRSSSQSRRSPVIQRPRPVRPKTRSRALPRWRDVRWVQTALNRILGVGLAVDGIIGSRTRAAIRRFQSQSGLSVDGIVGSRTGAALEAALRGARPVAAPWAPTPPTVPEPVVPSAPSAAGEPRVDIASNAVVSDKAVRVLKEILGMAGLSYAKITSGFRGPEHQARVMYDLIQRNGVVYAKSLYGLSGDKVIDVYDAGTKSGWSADEIKQAMARKIIEVGPTNVSRHGSTEYNVIDIGPNSSNYGDAENKDFHRAAHEAVRSGLIDKYLGPLTKPRDPAHHIEIKKQPTRDELMVRAFRARALPADAFRGSI